jgi:hypothetical protein
MFYSSAKLGFIHPSVHSWPGAPKLLWWLSSTVCCYPCGRINRPPEPALSALLLPSTSNHQGCGIASWYPLLCSSALLTSADPGSSPRSLLRDSVAAQRQAKWSNILPVPHNTSRDPSRAAQHMDHIFAAQLIWHYP